MTHSNVLENRFLHRLFGAGFAGGIKVDIAARPIAFRDVEMVAEIKVKSGGRDMDEMLHARSRGCLQEDLGRPDIGGFEISGASPWRGESGAVPDAVDTVEYWHQSFEIGTAQVEWVEFRPELLQLRSDGELASAGFDVDAATQEVFDGVSAETSGGAGDEDFFHKRINMLPRVKPAAVPRSNTRFPGFA